MSLLLLFAGSETVTRRETDDAGSSDTATLARTVRLGRFTDDAGSSDRASLVRTIQLGRVTDDAGASDRAILGRLIRLGRFTDDAGASDGLRPSTRLRFTDDAGAAELLTQQFGRRLAATDDAGSADDVDRRMDAVRAFLDDAGSADDMTLSRVMPRRYTDDAGCSDSALINGRPPFPEEFDVGWMNADLGRDSIIVLTAPLVAAGRYSDQRRDWTAAQGEIIDRCSVQPYTATEDTSDREFTSTHRRLFAPPGVALTAQSRVVFMGVTYEVDGEPGPWRDLDGRPSHIEAVLKRLTG